MPYVAIGLVTLSIAFTLISCDSRRYRTVIAYLRDIPTTFLQYQAVEEVEKNPSEYIFAEEQRMEDARLAREKEQIIKEARLIWEKERAIEETRLVSEKKRIIEEARLVWEKEQSIEEARLVSEKETPAPPDHQKTFREKESVSVGYMTYMVSTSSWSSGLRHVSKPDALFLVVVLAIRNDDKKARTIPPFRLVDERGVEYETTSKGRMQKEVINTLDSLNPNVVKKGVVIFDVPNGHSYRLKISGGYGSGGENAFVKLSL